MTLRDCLKHGKFLSKYMAIIFVIIAMYTQLSTYWSPIGGTNHQLLKFEVPFFLTLSLALYFPIIKERFFKYIVPAVPILVLYFSFDVFYIFLARSPRSSDLQNYTTIFDFSIAMAIAIIVFLLIIPLCVATLLRKAYKEYPLKKFILSLSCKLTLLCIIAIVISSNIFFNFILKSYDEITWSQQRSIRNNGRITSFIYYGIQEKQNAHKLGSYAFNSKIDIQNTLYPGSIDKKRNVHFIVLESFINPSLLEGVQFNKTPIADELKSYLNEYISFSNVISPVYGGGTAQAEFELLTGVKALAKINSTEFNVMSGNRTSSFVSHLAKHGYSTIATVASNSGYYNSLQAYKSLGFNEISFLEDNSNFQKNDADTKIFDGDLFNHNINNVKRTLGETSKPLFNYVLGMYGHFPYERNERDRPSIIDVKHKDERIHRVSNQFFYRTKALAAYIKELILIDPDSIIYITSDHLPPLIDNGVHYKFDKHTNISLLFNVGKKVEVNRKKYFEIPWLIWDLLSEVEHERDIDEIKMEEIYFKTLAESVKLPRKRAAP